MGRVFICLSASRGLFQWAIRKLTRSKVNHAFLIYESGDFGGWFAVEIAEDGPTTIPAGRALKDKSYLEVYEPRFDLREGMKRRRGDLGRGYDWLGIVGFLLKLIVLRVFRRDIDNPLQDEGRSFCSEYVTGAIAASPDSQLDGIDPDNQAPRHLSILCRRSGRFDRIEVEELRALGLPI